MTNLIPGEYDAALNGIRLHYTIRGSGPALIPFRAAPAWMRAIGMTSPGSMISSR